MIQAIFHIWLIAENSLKYQPTRLPSRLYHPILCTKKIVTKNNYVRLFTLCSNESTRKVSHKSTFISCTTLYIEIVIYRMNVLMPDMRKKWHFHVSSSPFHSYYKSIIIQLWRCSVFTRKKPYIGHLLSKLFSSGWHIAIYFEKVTSSTLSN